MKKILLLIIAVTAANSIKAQIPDYFKGNPKWYCTAEGFDDWATEENPYLSHINYYLKGDTLIQGETYHKVFNKGYRDYYHTPEEVDIAFDEPAWDRHYIRQEGRTIRYYDTSRETDSLLFDYRLGIGDTITSLSGYCLSLNDTVTKIDSILVDNEYRRKLYYNFGVSSGYVILEGIGQGYKDDLEPIFVECGYTGESFGFHCYGRKNQREWGYQDCILTASTEEIKHEIDVVNLHTASDKIYIQWPSNISEKSTDLILFNIQGKIIYQTQEPVTEISTENLSSGLYLIRIESSNQILTNEKIWIR